MISFHIDHITPKDILVERLACKHDGQELLLYLHLPGVWLACVASFSVGFSTRSRRFSLFGSTKIGASATLMEAAGRGRGGEKKETLARKPHDFEKCPFDTFAVGYIHSMTADE